MQIRKLSLLCFVSASILSLQAYAADPNEAAIEARQGYMKMVKFNAGPLFGMAKGKLDYNADVATDLAANLLQLSEMNTVRMWRNGSSDDDYAETDALAAIWKDSSTFLKGEQAFKDAVAALQPAAGQGQDALRSKIKDLGKSCKGCHDNFRAE